MGRAPCCDKANVKRGPWSPEEDATLRNYVEKNGTGGNWIALPHKAGLKRCGKSCRLRWLNYLRPDIKHGGFTEEEDNIICTLFNSIGSRWSVIASHLPGRTDNDVKNYWNTKLKKRVMAGAQTKAIHHSPSPAAPAPATAPPPPPPPPSVPAIKTEDFSGYGFNHNPYRFFSELPQFPMPGLIGQPDISVNGYVVSPSEDISAASSSIENSSSNSCINWSGSASVDDVFLSELVFGTSSDFLCEFGSQEKMGEIAPYYSSNQESMLGIAETKPQGIHQSITYS